MTDSFKARLRVVDARRTFSRRTALAVIASIAGGSALARAAPASSDAEFVARLEHEVGGRIGLAVVDIANGRRLSYRADEPFAMCSTFKLMLAAAILSR